MSGFKCDKCGGDLVWSDYCGCYVCSKCGQHVHCDNEGNIIQHLVCCFCGWNAHRSDPEARYREEWGW